MNQMILSICWSRLSCEHNRPIVFAPLYNYPSTLDAYRSAQGPADVNKEKWSDQSENVGPSDICSISSYQMVWRKVSFGIPRWWTWNVFPPKCKQASMWEPPVWHLTFDLWAHREVLHCQNLIRWILNNTMGFMKGLFVLNKWTFRKIYKNGLE